MKRSKVIKLSLGIIFLIVFLFTSPCVKKCNKQNNIIETQEKVEEAEWQDDDDEVAIGSNLFCGSSTAEGNGSVYVLDIGMYGGKPVGKDDRYNIYRQREGEWELFMSYSPRGMNDARSISNLVYLDGYIYYVLRETGMWGRSNYIFRVSEEDGSTNILSSCDVNFYFYEGEIYFKLHEKLTRSFYKMDLDGENYEVLYSDHKSGASDRDYAVGGGYLYLKDGEQVLGINLKTGERRSFKTDVKHIEGMFLKMADSIFMIQKMAEFIKWM